jgi:hypothetical protein
LQFPPVSCISLNFLHGLLCILHGFFFNPEDGGGLHNHCCGNLKSYYVLYLFFIAPINLFYLLNIYTDTRTHTHAWGL